MHITSTVVNNEQCRLLASTKSHQHQQHKSSNKQEHFHLPDNSTNLAKVVCKGLNLNSIINKGSGDMRKESVNVQRVNLSSYQVQAWIMVSKLMPAACIKYV